MSNFGLPGTGELLFRSYGGFLKDGANHFGEIGIDLPLKTEGAKRRVVPND